MGQFAVSVSKDFNGELCTATKTEMQTNLWLILIRYQNTFITDKSETIQY